MARSKLVRGAVVRLKRDVKTRGGRTFKAGLKMTVGSTERELSLWVRVRTKRMVVSLKKNDESFYLELVSLPESPREE